MTICNCLEKTGGVKGALIWLIFLIILLVFFSLFIGSYCENEPKAGMMFGILTVGYAVICGFLAWRITRKKNN